MPGFGTLPPWDTLRYFQTPRMTSSSPAGATRILPADSQRVAVIFSVVTSGVVITVGPTSAVTTGIGLGISVTAGPQRFTHADYGPLVQGEWWASGPGTAALTVIEISLSDWPYDITEPMG